jgi:cyclophilin family peptidyl-prolyl cis-trans isomerase
MLPRACVLGLIAITAAAWGQSRFEPPQAAPFTCGADQILPAPIVMSPAAVILAGDGRLYSPCPASSHTAEHREVREATLIAQADNSLEAELQWRAAQAEARIVKNLGTLTDPDANVPVQTACNAEIQVFDATSRPTRWQPGRLFFMLLNRNPLVKAEGAYGIGVQLSRPGLDPRLAAAAAREIAVCLSSPSVLGVPPPVPGVPPRPLAAAIVTVRALLLEDLGLARFTADADYRTAADALALETTRLDNPSEMLGAVKGLEALIRQNPQFRAGDGVIGRLRQLATYGARMTEAPGFAIDVRIRRLAMMALQAARDNDAYTLGVASFDADWQVRRLVAASLDLSDPQQAAIGERFAADPVFQVRHDLLSAAGRLAQRTHECAPILERFTDPSPVVVMRAIDALSPSCTDLGDAVKQLVSMAEKIEKPTELDWHIASRALTALARLKPGAVGSNLLSAYSRSGFWQVRAAVAALSVPLMNPVLALGFVTDKEPNVQTAALDALFRLRNPAVIPNAIEILKGATDYQLLRMAALVLKGIDDDQKPAASVVLLGALRRLTNDRKDTSRDPRVAILDRLAETLAIHQSADLLPYAFDFDDAVCDAAVTAYRALTGQPPTPQPKSRRYPQQPAAILLTNAPKQAYLRLESGVVTLELRPDVAPVTVARFAALANRGYYNGLTFHRVVPNFVVQGGSPGANEYVGDARYMRDEVGPQGVHVRGAVGISTRGGDTGDAQIFINLVDLPRLDRDYTVFAYVTSGMELVDKLLEGGRIVGITVR